MGKKGLDEYSFNHLRQKFYCYHTIPSLYQCSNIEGPLGTGGASKHSGQIGCPMLKTLLTWNKYNLQTPPKPIYFLVGPTKDIPWRKPTIYLVGVIRTCMYVYVPQEVNHPLSQTAYGAFTDRVCIRPLIQLSSFLFLQKYPSPIKSV